jgi:hypothetical protein
MVDTRKKINRIKTIIKGHYKNNTTERSGIFLMNHITEGLKVLDYLKADIIVTTDGKTPDEIAKEIEKNVKS